MGKFKEDYSELSALFNGIHIPEDKEVILKRQEAFQMMTTDMEIGEPDNRGCKRREDGPLRRQETIKRAKADTKEEFNETELANLKECAISMEINAEFGFLAEANNLFGLLFEKMKEKKFSASQRKVKVEIMNKIVGIHNIKYSYDEAHTWAVKALECLDAKDPASLVIETFNQSAEAIFQKAELLTEKSVSLSAETYGKESRAYAKSLMTYADYLSRIDQRQKANSMYEIALKIVSKEEGERSVASAKIIGAMSYNNFYIQSYSAGNFTVASEQAETAVQVIEEKLDKNNFLTVWPKNVMAAIMEAKAGDTSDEEEKSRLLYEAEKFQADCLAILNATLGNYNPFTSSMMMNMGVTYRESGNNSEAEELLTKSLEIKEKILGEDMDLSLGHFHLFMFYFRNIQDYGKAEHHLLESLRIEEKVYGPSYSTLGVTYDWLIDLYSTTGEIDKENEAQKKYEQWEKLREEQWENLQEDEDNEKNEEEKEENEMSLEELIKFVTANDTILPSVKWLNKSLDLSTI